VLLLRGSTLSVFGEDPAWLVNEQDKFEDKDQKVNSTVRKNMESQETKK
jgi:hypothetical protein